MEQRALSIFAKFPNPGEVKTRLGNTLGMGKAAAIYRNLAEHAFMIGDEVLMSGVRVYLFFAPENSEANIAGWARKEFRLVRQEGPTLGDRMKSAFDRTFAEGASKTIIIGADVPELDGGAVLHAFEMLSSHEIVIGPSPDGGYYLLGMNAPTKNVFTGIEWSTQSVYSTTLERVRELQLTVCALPGLADIDTEDDYRGYLGRLRENTGGEDFP